MSAEPSLLTEQASEWSQSWCRADSPPHSFTLHALLLLSELPNPISSKREQTQPRSTNLITLPEAGAGTGSARCPGTWERQVPSHPDVLKGRLEG